MSPIPPMPPCGSGGGGEPIITIVGADLSERPAPGDVPVGTVFIDESDGNASSVSTGTEWVTGSTGSSGGCALPSQVGKQGYFLTAASGSSNPCDVAWSPLNIREFGQSMRMQEAMADYNPLLYYNEGGLASGYSGGVVAFSSAEGATLSVPFSPSTTGSDGHRLDVQATARTGTPIINFDHVVKPDQAVYIQTSVGWLQRGNDRESGPYSGAPELMRSANVVMDGKHVAAAISAGAQFVPEASSSIVDWVNPGDNVTYAAGCSVLVMFLNPPDGNPFVGDPVLADVVMQTQFGAGSGMDCARLDVRGFAQQFSNPVPPLEQWDY